MNSSSSSMSRNASDAHLCCPICFEKYSDSHPPVSAPACMHSICQPCAKQRDSAICVMCNRVSYAGPDLLKSSRWLKNFGLIEQLEKTRELEEKLADLRYRYESAIDYLSCGQCGVREKRERMKICCTCAGLKMAENVWKRDESNKVLLRSVTVCAHCFTKQHLNHDVANYQSYEVQKILRWTSRNGVQTVNGMNELCIQEIYNGAMNLDDWNEAMRQFQVKHREGMSYRECLVLTGELNREVEIVCNASEATFPALRKFTRTVKESQERISSLLSGMERKGVFWFDYYKITSCIRKFLTGPYVHLALRNGGPMHAETIAKKLRENSRIYGSFGRDFVFESTKQSLSTVSWSSLFKRTVDPFGYYWPIQKNTAPKSFMFRVMEKWNQETSTNSSTILDSSTSKFFDKNMILECD